MKNQSLYEQLYEYGQRGEIPFHMPGHKRQRRPEVMPQGFPWEIDITEIDGFDNLHHAEGILKESMGLAASFYGTEKSFYCINGSTAGILSAIFSVTKPGDMILMARNSHKSVYHAVFLRELTPMYVYPQMDVDTGIACGYSPIEIEDMLKRYPEIKAVVITSPTYEGVISDIARIAELVHEHEIPLIVDEAHGAHLTMKGSSDKQFPVSATCLGADLVIQSLHKTLPALTQTALLHVCRTSLQKHEIFEKEAARYMGIFQTSSPSYVLMASIDACVRYMISPQGQDDQRKYAERLQELRENLRDYTHIRLLEPQVQGQKLDPSKITLQAVGMTGKQLYDILRLTYHLQPEMCTDSYVLLMTSMFDTSSMYESLLEACSLIDAQLSYDSGNNAKKTGTQERYCLPKVCMIYTPAQTELLQTEEICLQDSVGRVSAEYAYQYPPGIPLLVPGERIEQAVLERLIRQAEMGLEIQGLRSMDGETILIVK